MFRDLQRPHLPQCAASLTQDLTTADQEAALLHLRTAYWLLALDRIEAQNVLMYWNQTRAAMRVDCET